MDQTTPTNKSVPWNLTQRRQKSNMGCSMHLFARGYNQETARSPMHALHFFTDPGGQFVREKAYFFTSYGCTQAKSRPARA